MHSIVSKSVGLGNSFPLVDKQFVFAVKRSDDLLGLSTTRTGIGSTSTSLYFVTIVDNNLTDHSLKTTHFLLQSVLLLDRNSSNFTFNSMNI